MIPVKVYLTEEELSQANHICGMDHRPRSQWIRHIIIAEISRRKSRMEKRRGKGI
jgi:hypothetical protein